MEQTMAVASVQQLLNGWASDLDLHDGANIGDYVTEDVVYNVGGEPRQGIAATKAFYKARVDALAAKEGPRQVMRHVITGFRTQFNGPRDVTVNFNLIFWATGIPDCNPADVIAVADVAMDCHRGADGEWKIAKFDSHQPLKRMG